MAKVRKVFLCRSCGSVHPRWMGKCPDCGTWDSLEEVLHDPNAEKDAQRGIVAAWAARAEGDGEDDGVEAAQAQPLAALEGSTESHPRLPTGIAEFDRVLGGRDGVLTGGIVPGSAVLIGGEPGIGKSTLLLQSAFAWARLGHKVLYVSSEESAQQVAQRAGRVSSGDATGAKGVASVAADNLFILADTNLARIVEQARRIAPKVIVIDSIQMVYKPDVPAAPGSVTQLRRCCADLVYLAKASGIAIVLVGHVTKEGQLAGPRLLEHLVDAVVAFEGDRYHSHRVVRAVKNRFGTTLEIGLFEMTGAGLREVAQGGGVVSVGPSRPGSVLCPVMTGTRCILVEVQALTATGFLGAAKRKCSGLDANRLAMLIAVLEQHAELRLADRDIFASSVGGLRVAEPASDLALLLAIAGAHYRKALPPATAAIGEVGLGGEIRPVAHLEQRVREGERLGCTRLLVPGTRELPKAGKGVELVRVKGVHEAIGQFT